MIDWSPDHLGGEGSWIGSAVEVFVAEGTATGEVDCGAGAAMVIGRPGDREMGNGDGDRETGSGDGGRGQATGVRHRGGAKGSADGVVTASGSSSGSELRGRLVP